MNKKNIILILLAIIMILNLQIAFAVDSPDYSLGYSAGFEQGEENSSKSEPDSPGKALQSYKGTEAYKLFSGDKKEFDIGFLAGYKDGLDEKKEEEDVKINYADVLGTSLGSIYGARDFQEGRVSDWRRSLPSDRSIINMYNLNVEKRGYIEVFLESFKLKFEEAYNIAFEKANFEPIKTTLEAGVKDGENLGKLLGSIYGAKDYFEGLYIDFQRNMLRDTDIIINYALNNDYPDYKEGFIAGFKRAYEMEYNKIYREANIDNTLRDERDAYTNGKNLGIKMGEMQAVNDFMEKKSNDWRISQKTADNIIVQYSLTLQSPNYREGFISGFQDGYSQGYNSKYKSLSQDSAMDQTVAEVIPISGGILTSHDGIFTVTIDKGTFYNPVNLTIDTIGDYGSYVGDNYIKGSEVVKVNILNTSGALDNEKPIELKFEYYGNEKKSGIYKFVNGNWLYINSFVEEGFIKTIIKPKSIKDANGIYAVLLNQELTTFHDIRGHWARGEIETLIRRNIIYGYTDNTFKAENKITRAEFLTLLSRVYKWPLPTYTANTMQFKDYASFGNRNNIISYALAQGYIQGYPDNTFRPNDLISYRELEIIMRRFIDKEFKWHHTAAKMLYEKNTRTSFYDSIDNKINRGEVSYMLYILNDWRY